MTRRFEGVSPEATAWWARHLADKILVKIQCGQCRKLIGEIRRDGDQVMALRRMIHPEPTVPRPEIGASNVWELGERRAEHDTYVLRPGSPTADGRPTEVMKQHRKLADAVAPIDLFPSYVCPKHGEIPVDIKHLTQFVSESDDTLPTRLYPIPYSADVDWHA